MVNARTTCNVNHIAYTSTTAAVILNGFTESVGVPSSQALPGSDVGVVVVTVDIGADAVAVVVADTGAGGPRAFTIAVNRSLKVVLFPSSRVRRNCRPGK